MDENNEIRQQLGKFLAGGMAFMPFSEAVANFPITKINTKPPHVSYTPWHLLEHLRITQKDILDFIVDPNYKELNWPKDYWPAKNANANKKQWDDTISNFENDLLALQELVKNPKTDLNARVKNGNGQTIIREILLVIDHNAYHIGEFSILRQTMQTWPKSKKA